MNDDVSIERVSVDVHLGKASNRRFSVTSFKNEQGVQNCLDELLYASKASVSFFFWKGENEEKEEPGFPDLLCVDSTTSRYVLRNQNSWKGGVFKFEPTQPRFYKLHPMLRIQVVVWDAQEERCIVLVLRAAQAAPWVWQGLHQREYIWT